MAGVGEGEGREKNHFFCLLIGWRSLILQYNCKTGNVTENVHVYSFSQVHDLYKIVTIFFMAKYMADSPYSNKGRKHTRFRGSKTESGCL